MKRAKVFCNDIYAGTLTQTDEKSYIFRYDEDYRSNPDTFPVSLTMPKSRPEYVSEVLFPFFVNMLSEGINKKMQCQVFRIDEEDYFSLLIATAPFETIGAVTVQPYDE